MASKLIEEIRLAQEEWEREKSKAQRDQDYSFDRHMQDLEVFLEAHGKSLPSLSDSDEDWDTYHKKTQEFMATAMDKRRASDAEMFARIDRATANYMKRLSDALG